jgi:hypothetical protein
MTLSMVIAGALFAFLNDEPLRVHFVLVNSPAMSSGLWLLTFLAAGVILGTIVSSFVALRHQHKLTPVSKEPSSHDTH